MSLRKRHIDVDPDTSVKDLFRLLNVTGDSVTMLVEGEQVQVGVHAAKVEQEDPTQDERRERARLAMEKFRELVDLDELERYIYEGRDDEPIKPPVTFE